MFSKLTKVTASTARQVVRANQQFNHGRWISTSSGNNRSDVLTQTQSNEKLKLEQQERWRVRRTERFVDVNFSKFCLKFCFMSMAGCQISLFSFCVMIMGRVQISDPFEYNVDADF